MAAATTRRWQRCREHAGFRRVNRDIGGDGLDLGGHQVRRKRKAAVTPIVFCAVTAVMALVP